MSELSLADGRPTLPRGPHRLTADEVKRSQRGRMLQGVVEVVAEQGWHATTVAAIAARAGVSRRTFYEHFTDREACFRTAYQRAARLHMRRTIAAGDAHAAVADAARARVEEYLRVLAAEPAFARALMVEVLAAGPVLREQRRAVLRSHAVALRDLHARTGREVRPLVVYTALMGAADELVRAHVEESRIDRLPRLTGPITDLYTTALEHPWT